MLSAPYGSWSSPFTVDWLTGSSVGLGGGWIDGDDAYWLESRPRENGRTSLWRRHAGVTQEVTPGLDVRSRVNEYGGGAFAVQDGTVVVSTHPSGDVLVIDPGMPPRVVAQAGALRYGGLRFVPGRRQVLAVREDHTHSDLDCVTTLVLLDLDTAPHPGRVLAEGADFYAQPTADAHGRLAWVQWDHPAMPWDETRLVAASLADPRNRVTVASRASVLEPTWAADGSLVFLSDASGHWNFHRWDGRRVTALHAHPYDFATPPWTLDPPGFALLGDGRIGCAWLEDGVGRLGILEDGRLTPVATGAVSVDLAGQPGRCVVTLGFPDRPAGLFVLDWDTGATTLLRAASDRVVEPDWVSRAQAVHVTTPDGPAHAWFYPPTSPYHAGPPGELPPVIVNPHGGPTGMSSPAFSVAIQYWTSRGYGWLDVNYAGSSGFGRAYRERLRGRWGLADVRDCIAAARTLVVSGRADPDRLVMRGTSAGGYTTLRALTTSEVFAAGISLYGIGDLEALAQDTHKFESRYFEGLIAPYPEGRDIYVERSPIHHLDRLQCPLLVLQGAEDRVVPPSQAESFAAAARAKGLPVALVVYPEEGHGFRRADTIRHAYETVQSFLGQVFGFEPADQVLRVRVENLPPR